MTNLRHSLKEDMSNLLDLLEPYWAGLSQAEANLSLTGKPLGIANQEQVAWQSYFDEKRIQLNGLLKLLNQKVDAKKGELWKSYTEKSKRELNSTDKVQYVNANPAYHTIQQLQLEVQEIYDRYQSICDAFKMRGFALRNLTDLYINSLQDTVL